MAGYVFNSNISWLDFLQAEQYAREAKEIAQEMGNVVSIDISKQTREIIASQETLAREQIHIQQLNLEMVKEQFEETTQQNRDMMIAQEELARAQIEAQRETLEYSIDTMRRSTQRIVDSLEENFEWAVEKISKELTKVSHVIQGELKELQSSFDWGFSRQLAELGHINDNLTEIVAIAKTPVQTTAFNHFEIARDAHRQRLYLEALEELDKAVNGDHTFSGYKLEWRFHYLRGVIRLGSLDCEPSLVNLCDSEDAFLLAARYARADYPEDAGRAYLSAGWAAYCQGKMQESLKYTEEAMKIHPQLAEAFFQMAKVHMAINEPKKALPFLGDAIKKDPFFALKAAGDGDFQKYETELREYLEMLRQEKIGLVTAYVAGILKELSGSEFPDSFVSFKTRLDDFLKEGASWPLMDVFSFGIMCNSRETQNIIAEEKSRQEKFALTANEASTFLEQVNSHELSNNLIKTKTLLRNFLIKGSSLPRKELDIFIETMRIAYNEELMTELDKNAESFCDRHDYADAIELWKKTLIFNDENLEVFRQYYYSQDIYIHEEDSGNFKAIYIPKEEDCQSKRTNGLHKRKEEMLEIIRIRKHLQENAKQLLVEIENKFELLHAKNKEWRTVIQKKIQAAEEKKKDDQDRQRRISSLLSLAREKLTKDNSQVRNWCDQVLSLDPCNSEAVSLKQEALSRIAHVEELLLSISREKEKNNYNKALDLLDSVILLESEHSGLATLRNNILEMQNAYSKKLSDKRLRLQHSIGFFVKVFGVVLVIIATIKVEFYCHSKMQVILAEPTHRASELVFNSELLLKTAWVLLGWWLPALLTFITGLAFVIKLSDKITNNTK